MLWNKEIEQVEVQWKQFGPNEATWEMANHMRALYPSLLANVFGICVLVIYVYVCVCIVNIVMSCVIKLQ